MKNNLLFDFTVDKTTNTVFVNREFTAELPLVWDAFTKKEILDQWWAPQPWLSKTKQMDFKVGGRRLYAMCSPEGQGEGQEHWSTQNYTAISPKTNFQFHSAFCDKDGNITPESPNSDWSLDFSEKNGITTVNITIKHKTPETLERMIQMGFQGGFTMTLNYLDQLLSDLSKKK
ncbi:MAG: SRPBCC family protein [Bacteroidia bacterium]